MVDERKKKGKGYSKRKSKAHTAQDTIPFDEIYENGLFRSGETFSILFMFENIDYKVMRENEKDAFYEKYMHFLNTLPQDVQYQELILNYPTDREMIEEAIVPKNDNQLCSRAVRRDYCQVMEGVVETAADQSCEQVILSAMSYTPQTKLNDVGILFKYFKALQDEGRSVEFLGKGHSAYAGGFTGKAASSVPHGGQGNVSAAEELSSGGRSAQGLHRAREF